MNIQRFFSEYVPGTSSAFFVYSDIVSDMSTKYYLVSKSIWSALLKNAFFSESNQCALHVLKHNYFEFLSKLELEC